jgi:hypothetical protein
VQNAKAGWLSVPANASATVFLPAISNASQVTEDGNSVESHYKGGAPVVQVGSGSYYFQVKWVPCKGLRVLTYPKISLLPLYFYLPCLPLFR